MSMQNVMREAERRRASISSSARRAGRGAGVRTITVRDLPAELSTELARLSRERKLSLNRLVIELLAERLGLAGRAAVLERPPDELDELAGTWKAEEADAFDRAIAEMRRVDEELWR